jgi:hypothetical protein
MIRSHFVSEDSYSANSQTLPVQRDSVLFEKRDHLAPIEITRDRQHRRARAAHVGQHFARIIDSAEVGQVARHDHQIAVAHHLAHSLKIAGRHMHVAKGDYLHRKSKLSIFSSRL